MSMQYLGVTWPAVSQRVEGSGRWRSWVVAEPDLAGVTGLRQVVAIARDQGNNRRADVILAALVRLAAVDGGNDQDAAYLVALLLTNGTGRLARQLKDTSDDIEAIVAAQVWLTIREFPWRRRRQGIAQSILLDARRAVLADLGVPTARSLRWGVVILADPTTDMEVAGSGMWAHFDVYPTVAPGEEYTLAAVLGWATGHDLVSHEDAAILLDLAEVEVEVDGMVRGLAVATLRGCCVRTVRRRRDRAVRSLVDAREAYLRQCA
jgi:hypothetical protein